MATLTSSTDLIYLQPLVQRISLEVYLGNSEILPANIDQEITQREPAYFVDYFQKLNARRRGELIDLFVLEQFVVDIVLGHDKGDSSTLPLQAIVLYATFKNITLNLQLNTLSQITNISNQIVGIQALTSISEARPAVHLLVKKELDEFSIRNKLGAAQVGIIKMLNKEVIRELFAIPLWQDIFIKYKVLDSVDVKRRICFKYKLESILYQLLMGRNRAEIQAIFDTFLLKEKKYIDDLEELERIRKASETNNFAQLLGNNQDESMRSKVNRQFQRISKATSKFHVHFRLHSNLYINYLNPTLKKEFSVVINGLDLNIVKPKGRFHVNMGLMLKNFLVMFNLDKLQKSSQRSIFDGPKMNGLDRDSVRTGAPSNTSE